MTQTVGDLLRKNLATFGEHDAKKRRAMKSRIWKANGVFIDPDGPHVRLQAVDEAIERLLQRFPDFVKWTRTTSSDSRFRDVRSC
jgi:hypothetical protein